MIYLERNIDKELSAWKTSNYRKPLMLRGARQIGKSSTVRQLGLQFDHFIEINFDKNNSIKAIFENIEDIDELCSLIEAETKIPIIPGKTLLFLDEIQACIPAISSLRYFYENKQELHVIATGSLLEFALEEIPSFGVGRISSLFMYPFSFNEFLRALNEGRLLDLINKKPKNEPINDAIHQKLLKLYRTFLIVGGMPEVLKNYVINKDLLQVNRILSDLMSTYEDDFAKYKQRVPLIRLQEVFRMVLAQNGINFTFSQTVAQLSNIQIKESLDLLQKAGLIYSVTHAASNGIPLGADFNPKKRKYILFDTGLFQKLLGLSISETLISEDWEAVNKGNIAEMSIGLELKKNAAPYQKEELFYWERETKGSQAEVDFVIQKSHELIPIEVKAGTKGSMQSMFLFLKEKSRPFGIRISQENFGFMPRVIIYPLYAVDKMLDEI
jgi:uncharacterized protein